MQVINVCRRIFDYVFLLSTFVLLITSFRERVIRSKRETEGDVKLSKEDVELSKEEMWYNILQIVIVICALIIFIWFIIYGLFRKRFLWLLFVLVVPASLQRIAQALASVGIIGNLVKTNSGGRLSLKEQTSIFLISFVVLMLQNIDFFEQSIYFITNHFSSMMSDLLLLLIHVLVLFTYLFITCSLIPIPILFMSKLLRKIVIHIPGRSKLKKYNDFLVEGMERTIKQSQVTIGFLKMIKKKVIIKILCIPVVPVIIIIDIIVFLLNVLFSFLLTTIGYIVIISRIGRDALKKMLSIISRLSDKKTVAISFRIAIIAAFALVVIINRYDVFVQHVESSTAVLEFVASSIIIPVVFEWINSSGKTSIMKS